MDERPPLPNMLLKRPGIKLEAPSEENQFVFASDLHINPRDKHFIPFLEALFATFANNHLIFGGDTFNLEQYMPSASPVMGAFIRLAGESLGRMTLLGGNHDPRTALEAILKAESEEGTEPPPVYSYAYSNIGNGEPHHLVFAHGDDWNFITNIGSIRPIRKIATKVGVELGDRNNGDPFSKRLSRFSSKIQELVYRKILQPNTTAVVGHTHYSSILDLDDNRRIITSGCGFRDSLNGKDGEFRFSVTRLFGNDPVFETYVYSEETGQIVLVGEAITI